MTAHPEELARTNSALQLEVEQRRRAEAALRASEGRVSHLLDSTAEGIIGLDCEGNCTFVNASALRLLGYDRPAQLLGRNLHSLIHHTRADGAPNPLETCRIHSSFRDGIGVHVDEDVLWRADGTSFSADYRSFPIRDGPVVVGAVMTFLDNTDQKRMMLERQRLESQLQQSQRLESLGVLAGGIAHDFNNLLTGILGFASLAMQDLQADLPAHSALEQIEQSALRAADLTRQLLAYAGKGRFLVRPVNLSRIVLEMAELLRTVIAKKAQLQFDMLPGPVVVDADVAQLRQIVMNLITNASEALDGGQGQITIRTGLMQVHDALLSVAIAPAQCRPGEYVFLEVMDTGIGMDDATKAKIFDPFFTTKFTGRALGLAAVQGIIRGHRGAVKIDSQPGKGTRFLILLPRSASSEELPGATPPLLGGWQSSGTILVADDEETIRRLCQRVLEKAGFTVLLAEDGQRAIEQFTDHAHQIALVVLDLTMPRLSGQEVFRQLKGLRPDMRAILMSGYNEQEALHLFVGQGLAGFVQKPFSAIELAAKVRDVIEGPAVR